MKRKRDKSISVAIAISVVIATWASIAASAAITTKEKGGPTIKADVQPQGGNDPKLLALAIRRWNV